MNTSTNSTRLQDLLADLTAGVVVFLVALPLCLGIALASGAAPIAGIVAGIVGGIVVGMVSKSHTSVSGPAAGLTAIVSVQIEQLEAFQTFLAAVFLAGIVQVAFGVAKAGSIADFVPSAVIKGLLSAIGLILILKQIPHLFGHDTDPEGEMSFMQPDRLNTFSEIIVTLTGADIHYGVSIIGVLSIPILILWEKNTWLKKTLIPGPLVVVLLGVVTGMWMGTWGDAWVIRENHLVNVPIANNGTEWMNFIVSPRWTDFMVPAVYMAAVTIALVASLETLLNLEAIDKLDPMRRNSPPNRELIAQGAGNMVCGLIGGLPVTSVIVRSTVNIHAGGRTKRSTILHGILLMVCVVLVPHWLNRIPLSSLAAILIVTGWKLASPKIFKLVWKSGWDQFLPFVVTVSAILFTDLLKGIVIGLVFSILFILRSNLRKPLRRYVEKHIDREVLRIELANQVSFLNRVAIRNALDAVPTGGSVLIDAHSSDYIDADVLAVIQDYVNEIAPARNVEVSMAGFKDVYRQQDDQVRFVDYVTEAIQESLTPERVRRILEDGNERFRTGQPIVRDLIQSRLATVSKHFPLAVILSGASARVPVEIIFDSAPGTLFCVRITGNLPCKEVVGSLEFACNQVGAKLIVIMAHSNNHVIGLALEQRVRPSDQVPESLASILKEIQPLITDDECRIWQSGDPGMRSQIVDAISLRHAIRSADRVLAQSPVLSELVSEGRVGIVTAMYQIASGKVEFFDTPVIRNT